MTIFCDGPTCCCCFWFTDTLVFKASDFCCGAGELCCFFFSRTGNVVVADCKFFTILTLITQISTKYLTSEFIIFPDICICHYLPYYSKIPAESFYYVKYGLSIITSKIPSKILSNENKKTGVSRKIVCFGILIHVLS